MDASSAGQTAGVNGEVVVVGSANLDVVFHVEQLPRPGETVLALGRSTGPGGKGANQALAAARAGARTALLAALGPDEGAEVLRAALASGAVDTTHLRAAHRPTGSACVFVDRTGENCIVVDSGANSDLVDLTYQEAGLIAQSRVTLCQLEVPLATVASAFALTTGVRMLNAAPAQPLPSGLLEQVDVLIVNEQEAQLVSRVTYLDAAVQALLTHVPEVLVTLGASGAVLARRDAGVVRIPAVAARRVVDTTGAGDTFCGAFAARRAAGDDPVEAAGFAVAAASLSVERAGAASAPSHEQVRERLAQA